MRVLHILPPAAGGMLRHVQSLLLGLDPARYDQHCAAAPGPGLEAIQTSAPGRAWPLPLHDGAGPGALVHASVAVAWHARSLRPDLLHAHGYRAMVLAALASRLCRRPFVFTAHSLPDDLGARFWRVAGPLASHARAIVCVSRAVRDELIPHLAPRARRSGRPLIRVVYNGVDPGPPPGPRADLPGDLDAPGCRPVVLTAARLAPQKGVGVLLDAWAGIARSGGAGVLVLAGDGPLRADLEARAGQLGVTPRVRFAGFRDDVARLLRAADLAVVPSLREGQSLFVLEAMAAGAPVVASATGGLAEMVRHEETGLLVPPGDPRTLEGAMRRVLANTEHASRLAAAARQYVETEMTRERMLAGMAAFYEELGA